MSTYDAVWLAVAAGALGARDKRCWMAAGTPLLLFTLSESLCPFGMQHYGAPAAALSICLIVPGHAPSALLLALAEYRDFSDYALATFVWPGGLALVRSLDTRFAGDTVPRRLRGAPIQLLACAILYFTLLPLSYL